MVFWKVVAQERWPLTRGSNYSDLAREILVFWKVVAQERWPLTRGSNYSDLAREILVFWKSSSSREMAAKGGSTVCSHSSNISTLHPHSCNGWEILRCDLDKNTKNGTGFLYCNVVQCSSILMIFQNDE